MTEHAIPENVEQLLKSFELCVGWLEWLDTPFSCDDHRAHIRLAKDAIAKFRAEAEAES